MDGGRRDEEFDEAALIAAAEAAVSALGDTFRGRVMDDLAAIEAALARVDDRASLEAIYTVAHDLKGQAGSFGYALMTEFAGDLCAVLRRNELRGAALRNVVAAYAASFRHVIERDLKGDGGTPGRELRAKLNAAVKKLAQPAAAKS